MSTGLVIIVALVGGFILGMLAMAAIVGQGNRDAQVREERERQAYSGDGRPR